MASLNHIPQLAIPPEQQDPLSNYSKLVGIQQLQTHGEIQKQQLQANELENQQRQIQVAQAQQDQKDQINFRDAFQKANGDPDQTVKLAAQAGVGPKLLVPFQQNILEHKTKLLTYSKEQQAFAQSQADIQKGAWDAVNNAPEADKPKIYQEQLQGLSQLGIDTSKMPPQYDPQSFQMIGAVVTGHKQLLEDTFKQAESAKNKSQGELADTENKLKQNELASAQAGGAVPGIPLETQAANAWLKKPENAGKDISDFVSWKAKQSPAAITLLNQLGGGGAGSALDQAAERYSKDGSLPAGFGRSPGTTAAIIKRSAELHPDQDIAVNKATFSADTAALKKVQTTFDQVSAFENTALKNLDLYVEKAKAIPDIGVRFANVPLRAITKNMIGDANYAAMETARQTAATEAAKVLGSATASGVLSDSQKREALDVLDGKLPLAATIKVVDTFKQDFANRHAGYQQDIDAIKARLAGKPQKSPDQQTGAAQTQNAGGFDWNKMPEHKPK